VIGFAIVAAVLNGALAHIAIPVAWFVLSRWMSGRELIIASVAASIAAGIGKASYVGPPTIEVLAVVVELASTVLTGVLIATWWLARHGTVDSANG